MTTKKTIGRLPRYFLVAVGILCATGNFGIASAARDSTMSSASTKTLERLTLLNFSENPLEILKIDNDQKTKESAGSVRPYEATTIEVLSGNSVAYLWGDKHLSTGVRSTSDLLSDHHEHFADWSAVKPQVHVLGDAPLEKEIREQHGIRPTPELKVVVCGTTRGDLRIRVKPLWSPRGAARFLQLVAERFYDGCAIHRSIPELLIQFGIGADVQQRSKFRSDPIPDDPFFVPPILYKPGYMGFAGDGPDSRTNEVFIGLPGPELGGFGQERSWETPFGYMDFYDLGKNATQLTAYGDAPPNGHGPDPDLVYQEDGYEYLQEVYPDMDYIRGCTIVPDEMVETQGFNENTLSYDGLVGGDVTGLPSPTPTEAPQTDAGEL